MSKYEPLGEYLRKQKFDRIPISFSEIERILKAKLPPSKQHRAWWSNNPSNNVMTRQWLDAGFETSEVDVSRERLVFARNSSSKPDGKEAWNKLFGCMKGMVTFAPGFDATQPILEEGDWGSGDIGGLAEK